MKKFFKPYLIAILLFSILSVTILSIYRASVINNLENKKRIVDSSWLNIFINCSKRIVLLENLNSIVKSKNINVGDLNILMSKYRKYQNIYKSQCTLDFVKLEYDLNNAYLKIKDALKNDTICKSTRNNPLYDLEINDEKANFAIEKYNNQVLNYNKYISIFPNFIFAKNHGYVKRKYFNIKYGLKNDDPVIKSKESPDWAKGMDTL